MEQRNGPGCWRRAGAAQLLLEPGLRRQRGARQPARAAARLLLLVVLPRRDVAVVVHAPPPREFHARQHSFLFLFSGEFSSLSLWAVVLLKSLVRGLGRL
jgi:Ni/Fe-hydrogenase subunit HybB-like protein